MFYNNITEALEAIATKLNIPVNNLYIIDIKATFKGVFVSTNKGSFTYTEERTIIDWSKVSWREV